MRPHEIAQGFTKIFRGLIRWHLRMWLLQMLPAFFADLVIFSAGGITVASQQTCMGNGRRSGKFSWFAALQLWILTSPHDYFLDVNVQQRMLDMPRRVLQKWSQRFCCGCCWSSRNELLISSRCALTKRSELSDLHRSFCLHLSACAMSVGTKNGIICSQIRVTFCKGTVDSISLWCLKVQASNHFFVRMEAARHRRVGSHWMLFKFMVHLIACGCIMIKGFWHFAFELMGLWCSSWNMIEHAVCCQVVIA